ncbi:MAG: TolC family protein [Myxococcota bacterium]
MITKLLLLATLSAVPHPSIAPMSVSASAPQSYTADAFARRVVKRAPDVEAAQLRAEQARQAAAEVRTAFVPTLEATLRATRLFQPDNGSLVSGLPPAGSFDEGLAAIADPAAAGVLTGIVQQLEGLGDARLPVVRNQAALNLRLTIPISDVFTTIAAAHREAKAGAAAQQALVASSQAEVRLRALEAYYGYVRATSLLKVTEAAVARVSSQVTLVTSAQRLGTATQADVLAVQARQAQAEIDRIDASARVDAAADALRILAELPEGAALSTDALPGLAPIETSLPELQRRATASRPELDAAALSIDARREGLKRAKWDRAPKLALVGNVDTARPNPRIVPLDERFATTADASLVLSWSPNALLSGGPRVKAAKASMRAASADRDALARGVAVEVSGAYRSYEGAQAMIRQADAFVAAAEARYDAEAARLKRGAVTADTLVEADLEVTRAQAAQVDARARVHLAHAQLERAVGSLSQEDFRG